MKLFTYYFHRGSRYQRHLKVFKASAKKTMPDTGMIIKRVSPPESAQNHKTDTCAAFIGAAEYVLNHKSDIAVCDLDLMFIKSITDVWENEFDIAITVRDTIPYNTGLWFYRHNERSEKFLKQWIRNTYVIRDRYLKGNEELAAFVHHHGGLDQASLAMTIEKNKSAKILKLDSIIWNACQHEWERITDETKVIHIKSKLRKYCFNQLKNPPEYLIPLIKKWRAYYENS